MCNLLICDPSGHIAGPGYSSTGWTSDVYRYQFIFNPFPWTWLFRLVVEIFLNSLLRGSTASIRVFYFAWHISLINGYFNLWNFKPVFLFIISYCPLIRRFQRARLGSKPCVFFSLSTDLWIILIWSVATYAFCARFSNPSIYTFTRLLFNVRAMKYVFHSNIRIELHLIIQ